MLCQGLYADLSPEPPDQYRTDFLQTRDRFQVRSDSFKSTAHLLGQARNTISEQCGNIGRPREIIMNPNIKLELNRCTAQCIQGSSLQSTRGKHFLMESVSSSSTLPKQIHNNILIFAVVGCITPYPERMVATIWRNIRDIRFDFLDVVPVPLDFSIRDVRP